MTPAPPPWRVLDLPEGAADPGHPRPSDATRASVAVSRTVATVGGRRGLAALGGAAGLLVVAVALALTGGASREDPGVGVPSADPTGAATIVVEVAGAVLHPGIVRLPAGSRVADAIAAAGGFGPRVAADPASRELKLAAVLDDGARVDVPSRDDPVAAGVSGRGGSGTGSSGAESSAGPAGARLDLNRASAAELDGLPGIGPATAAKIIAARADRAFASPEDLLTRKLVSQRTFDAIRDLVAAG